MLTITLLYHMPLLQVDILFICNTHANTFISEMLYTQTICNSWLFFTSHFLPVFLTFTFDLFPRSHLLCCMSPFVLFLSRVRDCIPHVFPPHVRLWWSHLSQCWFLQIAKNKPSREARTPRSIVTYLPDFYWSWGKELRVCSGTRHLHHTGLFCANM